MQIEFLKRSRSYSISKVLIRGVCAQKEFLQIRKIAWKEKVEELETIK